MSNRETHGDETLFRRLGKLEQENASIVTNLENLTKAVTNLAHDVQSIKDGTRTNWGVLASWASVVVAIMVYHSNMLISPLKESFKDHTELEGHTQALILHAKTDERLKELKEATMRTESRMDKMLNTLDSNLQREMRDLDSVLQREIQLNDESIRQKVIGLEGIIRERTNNRFTAKEAEQMEKRIDILENTMLKDIDG